MILGGRNINKVSLQPGNCDFCDFGWFRSRLVSSIKLDRFWFDFGAVLGGTTVHVGLRKGFGAASKRLSQGCSIMVHFKRGKNCALHQAGDRQEAPGRNKSGGLPWTKTRNKNLLKKACSTHHVPEAWWRIFYFVPPVQGSRFNDGLSPTPTAPPDRGNRTFLVCSFTSFWLVFVSSRAHCPHAFRDVFSSHFEVGAS